MSKITDYWWSTPVAIILWVVVGIGSTWGYMQHPEGPDEVTLGSAILLMGFSAVMGPVTTAIIGMVYLTDHWSDIVYEREKE